jgi:DNA topoisomerase-2
LEKELIILSNKARYIQELLDDTIDLRKKKKTEIIDLLVSKGYNIIDEDGEFKYLIRMPMDSVSEENVEKLNGEHKDKSDELQRIKETTEQQMWLVELEQLEQEYGRFKAERNQGSDKKKVQLKAGSVTKKVIKKDKAVDLVIEETIDIELPVKAAKKIKIKTKE